MNTVTINRGYVICILIAVAFLLILVIAQYLYQRPMSPVTPNALEFLKTLREAPAATIVSSDGRFLVYSGGDSPTLIERCGQSQGTEIPAECKPDSLANPSIQNVLELLIFFKGKPGSSEATLFITTEGSVHHYKHCPRYPRC